MPFILLCSLASGLSMCCYDTGLKPSCVIWLSQVTGSKNQVWPGYTSLNHDNGVSADQSDGLIGLDSDNGSVSPQDWSIFW